MGNHLHCTFLPSTYGGIPNLLLPIPQDQMNHASRHLVETREDNIYQEYFSYIMQNTPMEFPSNWEEALRFYEMLTNYARNEHEF